MSGTVPAVPNQPKTPMHSFRCPHDLWRAAYAASKELDTTITAELQRALRNLVKRAEKKREAGQ